MPRQRNTRQRQAIEHVIEGLQRPLSPQEVLIEAKQEVPNLGLATVYRALNDMVIDGLLDRVDIPGQPPRYERSGLNHHHHFHCSHCDKVFDLEGCLLKKDLNLPEGFSLESHEVTLKGCCPDCNSAAKHP